MPVYHSGRLSGTDRPTYTLPLRPQTRDLTLPLAPKNLMVTSPFIIGKSDIRWDNPRLLPENNGLNIVGTNVYRATDSPEAPYVKLNTTPVGALFYRDETVEQYVVQEDATPTLVWTGEPDGKIFVYAQNKPLIKSGTNGVTSDRPQDVVVEIDDGDGNFLVVPAYAVNGRTGMIQLIDGPTWNYQVEQLIPPRLPTPPNGRVRISYYWLRHSVISALNQRIYYKVTTVVQNPDGSFIETPLAEVSARSTFDMEAIDYIWREAIRRNRWLLEQTGEQVKVFIRKWMGLKCEDYENKYGQSHADCHTCFPAGTPIRTESGWKPIESIKQGEKVLSSDGSYQKVAQTMERHFEGGLISILPSISTKPFLVTPDHPLLVMRGRHKKTGCGPKCDKVICDGDGIRLQRPGVRQLESGNWWARAQRGGERGVGRISLGTYPTREEAVKAVENYKFSTFTPFHELKWDTSDTIRKGDWLVPAWNKEIHDIDMIKIPEKFLKKSRFGPPRNGPTEIKVDEEFLWIVGLYIAEGSSGSRSVCFSLHRKETLYEGRVRNFFEKIGIKVSTYRRRGNGITVHASSSVFAEWFPTWLGDKCYHKRIPNEFMNLPSNKIWAILEGVYAGDGTVGENEIGQTSEYLALQMVELLHRVGEQPLTRSMQARALTPNGNRRRLAHFVNWGLKSLSHSNRKGRWKFKGDLLTMVKKVSKVPFNGTVYNLEVEGNHTYVVNGVVVHNCYGTGVVGGYEGPYDILIAPPETERMVELGDMGLHIRYDWNTWTTDYPMLNERDILVRPNNERYIVGPVNYQGSRGASYQQHFTISHIDELDIRYKVPITGGETSVPPAWDAYRQQTAPTQASPVIPVKPEIPEPRIIKGRTVTFENITY